MGQLLFKKCFIDAIRAGAKRTTIRRWPASRVKAGERAYALGIGYLRIESVEEVKLHQLTDADARADGFADLRALRRVLREIYPDAKGNHDGRAWFKIAFHVDPTKVSRAKKRARLTSPRRGEAKSRPGSARKRVRDAASGLTGSVAHRRRALADHLRRSARNLFP